MNKLGEAVNSFQPIICRDYKDVIRSLIFIIETKWATDSYVDILSIYEMIICSVRYGNVVRFENDQGEIVGVICYTIGTAEDNYEDTHIAHIVYCLLETRVQRFFHFLHGFQSFIHIVQSEHDGVTKFKMETYEHFKHTNQVYSKFAHKKRKFVKKDRIIFMARE